MKREVVKYIIFGFITTLINLICYQILNAVFGTEWYLLNNIVCWVIAVVFAFAANKLWVFESGSWAFCVVKAEIIGFVAARIFSLLLEEAGLFLMIDIIGFADFKTEILTFAVTGSLIAKTIMQIIVVFTNYILSKFLIFRKK